MKKIIVLSCLFISFLSCKKENLTESQKVETVFYYQLASKDFDDQLKFGEHGVQAVRVKCELKSESFMNNSFQEQLSTSDDDEDDDEDDEEENNPLFCLLHPNTGRCRKLLLPLTLEYFKTRYDENTNEVSFYWKTTYEDNLEKFYIMKSFDGKDFFVVGQITPHGAYKEYKFVEKID